MTNRERISAILHYQDYDCMPVVHFGFWNETLCKWVEEGHLQQNEITGVKDNSLAENKLSRKLGFDFNWNSCYHTDTGLSPAFESKVIKELPDRTKHIMNKDGVVVLQQPGAGSIPAEISHTLQDRTSWEEHYKWRFQWKPERVDFEVLHAAISESGENPLCLHCGSLFGYIRDIMGVIGISYLYVDDEPLFREIVDTMGELCYRNAELVLKHNARFDFAHFWEDICFKNGPLVDPKIFKKYIGPHYWRITELLARNGIDIVSLDCDGMIDSLIPVWLDNGVNTMFPIEVGTWNASIAPWREKYGEKIRGVGGMNKNVFSRDRAAVDVEVERLKPLVDMGGFIPCPDHRIPPDAKWDMVKYYCEQMRKAFGG